jgi:hypothetical protein
MAQELNTKKMKKTILFLSATLLLFMSAISMQAQDNLLTEASKVCYVTGSETIITPETDGSYNFSPNSSNQIRMRLYFSGYDITRGKAFIAVEYSGNDAKNHVTRSLTLDGKAFGTTTANNKYEIITLQNGHKLALISFLNDNLTVNSNKDGDTLKDHYLKTDAAMKLTLFETILYGTNNTDPFTVYNIGIYNIRELKTKYLEYLPDDNVKLFQILWNSSYKAYLRLIANSSQNKTDKTIAINAANTPGEVSEKAMKLLMEAIGTPTPTNTELDLRGVTVPSDEAPLKVDILNSFINGSTLRNVLFAANDTYKHFPTMTPYVTVVNGSYKAYKDGVAPGSAITKVNGSTPTPIYSYTRNFVEGFNSCVLPFDITTSELPTGLSAYVFSSATDEGAVTFAKANETISAGTPFIVKATEEGIYLIPAASTPNQIDTPNNYYPTDASNNIQFVGSFVNEVPTGDYASSTNYGISTNGTKMLKMADDTKTTYYRAFIADKRTTPSRVLSISFDEGDGTTAIVSPEAVDGLTTKSVYYDLQGRRVANPSKGLYIVNGKKVIIK